MLYTKWLVGKCSDEAIQAYKRWCYDEDLFHQSYELLFSIAHMNQLQYAQLEEMLLTGYAYAFATILEARSKWDNGSKVALDALTQIWESITKDSYGWIYIVADDSTPEFYKVGKSKKPLIRVRKMGSERLDYMPKKRLVHLIRSHDYHRAEKELHKILEIEHVGAEWFFINDEMINFLKRFTVVGINEKGVLVGK